MAEIYIIRHGQASFAKEDYDRLSELGEAQSARTGAVLRDLGPIDHVVAGQMRRHLQTFEHAERGYGGSFGGELVVDGGFDEYDYMDVIRGQHPEIVDRRALLAHMGESDQPERAFVELLRGAVLHWLSGQDADRYREPYAAFSARVLGALARLEARLEPGQKAAVFTSGGVVATLCQETMAFPRERIFEMNLAIVNASMSAWRSTAGRRSPIFINSFTHLLSEPAMVTRI